MNAENEVALSTDGVPIHYDVQGNGAVALVFVHGWCCHRGHWEQQMEYFTPGYTVVCLDLAGHGASGRDRTQWTMQSFGQDVVAVVEQLGLTQVVLIGHSMGGSVILEAARRLATTVIGLVGLETWRNIEQVRTSEQAAALVAPFRTDFVAETRSFVRSMFVPSSEPALVEKTVTAMSAAPPRMAISALEAFWEHNRPLEEVLQEIKAPKIMINSSFHPTNIAAAQLQRIVVLLMSGIGHFVMIEDSQALNRLLDEAVLQCLHAQTPRRNCTRGMNTHGLTIPPVRPQ